MMTKGILVSLIVAFACLFAGASAAEKPPDKFACWILHQKAKLEGDCQVFNCRRACKFVSTGGLCTLVAHEPEWVCFIYNDKKRTFFRCDTRQGATAAISGRVGLARAMTSYPFKAADWKLSRRAELLGHKAEVWTAKSPSTGVQGEVWVASEMSVPPSLEAVLEAFYGWPRTSHQAMRFYVTVDGHRRSYVDTYRIERKLVSMREFVVPQGYKQTKTEGDVMVDDDSVADIINGLDLGGGREAGRHK
jgi:hypothetical protein